jgi:hypothetical protein
MASVGLGNSIVVELHARGYKASNIKLELQRMSRSSCKTWFPAGSILRNEEHADAAVRELLDENGLTLTSMI